MKNQKEVSPFETLTKWKSSSVTFVEGGLRCLGKGRQKRSSKPFISVIIAVYNGEMFLAQTIESVIHQSYQDIELIIIDGGSTDKTIDVLNRYDEKINYWISEPDLGISDAFNKGVQLAHGDYLIFQGDGDGFFSSQSVEKMVEGIDVEKDIFICGKIQRISLEGEKLYHTSIPKKFKKRSLLFKMSLPHQGLFTHISFFKKHGLFDLKNTFCMDYEILLRAYHEFPKVVIKEEIVSNWREDGIGNNKTEDILKEYNFIKKRNKVAHPFFLYIIDKWNFFKYFLKQLKNKIEIFLG